MEEAVREGEGDAREGEGEALCALPCWRLCVFWLYLRGITSKRKLHPGNERTLSTCTEGGIRVGMRHHCCVTIEGKEDMIWIHPFGPSLDAALLHRGTYLYNRMFDAQLAARNSSHSFCSRFQFCKRSTITCLHASGTSCRYIPWLHAKNVWTPHTAPQSMTCLLLLRCSTHHVLVRSAAYRSTVPLRT